MGDEPRGTVYVVRIGQHQQPTEVTIFYRPREGFEVHNGYLLEDKEMTTNGRRHHRLAIVTWLGNKIIVRRYNRTGEISCEPPLYWVEKETVTF